MTTTNEPMNECLDCSFHLKGMAVSLPAVRVRATNMKTRTLSQLIVAYDDDGDDEHLGCNPEGQYILDDVRSIDR